MQRRLAETQPLHSIRNYSYHNVFSMAFMARFGRAVIDNS